MGFSREDRKKAVVFVRKGRSYYVEFLFFFPVSVAAFLCRRPLSQADLDGFKRPFLGLLPFPPSSLRLPSPSSSSSAGWMFVSFFSQRSGG